MNRLNRILNITDNKTYANNIQHNKIWIGILLTGIILAFQLPNNAADNTRDIIPIHIKSEETSDNFEDLKFIPAEPEMAEDEIIIHLNDTKTILVPIDEEALKEQTSKRSNTIIEFLDVDEDLKLYVFDHGDDILSFDREQRDFTFQRIDTFPERLHQRLDEFHHEFDSILKEKNNYLQTFEMKHDVFDSLFKKSEKNLFEKERALADLFENLPEFEFDESNLFELKEMEESMANLALEKAEHLKELYESGIFEKLHEKESWIHEHEADLLRELKERKLFEQLPGKINKFNFDNFPNKFNDFYFNSHSGKLAGLDQAFESEMRQLGIKERNENYKLELSQKHLKIDGKKQPGYIHERFVEIYEEIKGKPLSKKSKVIIQVEE